MQRQDEAAHWRAAVHVVGWVSMAISTETITGVGSDIEPNGDRGVIEQSLVSQSR